MIQNYQFSEKDLLGEGGFGKVYKARSKNNQEVAIKIQNKTKLGQQGALSFAEQEIKFQKQLNSKHILKMYESFCDPQNLYIVLEYCPQGDLRKYLRSRPQRQLSEQESIAILTQIKDGFKEIISHQMIHRDIKPENILLKDGMIKISDFGLAAQCDQKRKNLRQCCGTPIYMSPQVMSHESYSAEADIWSLGIMFYEMLFSKAPWDFYSEKAFLANLQQHPEVQFPVQKPINETTKDFIKKCLRIREDERIDWIDFFQHKIFSGVPNAEIRAPDKNQDPNNNLNIAKLIDSQARRSLKLLKEGFEKSDTPIGDIFEKLTKKHGKSINRQIFVKIVQQISDDVSQNIEHLFSIFDIQRRGEISLDLFARFVIENDFRSIGDRGLTKSIKNIVQKYGLIHLFAKLDQDSSQNLDFAEFSVLIREIAPGFQEQDIQEIFQQFDLNGNGQINFAEFSEVCGIEKEDQYLQKQTNFVKQILLNLKEYLKKNQIQLDAVFKKFDTDNSKSLDIKEFTNFMNKIYQLSQKEILACFRYIDSNNSGSIVIKELEKAIEGVSAQRDIQLNNDSLKLISLLRQTIKERNADPKRIFEKLNSSQYLQGSQKGTTAQLTVSEFYLFLEQLCQCLNIQLINDQKQKLFNFFDVNKDGSIDVKEFASLLKK